MGNVALRTARREINVDEGSRSKKVVTVVKQDGSIVEFPQEFRVSKLLRDFPGHVVCRSAELGPGGKARVLSPNAVLQRGKVYLLLFRNQINLPNSYPRKSGSKSSKINPLVVAPAEESGDRTIMCGESPPGPVDDDAVDNAKRPRRIRLVMTKQQLAKMLSDGSISMSATGNNSKDVISSLQILSTSIRLNRPGLSYTSMRLFNRPIDDQITCDSRPKRNWCPELDSIVEVPSQ